MRRVKGLSTEKKERLTDTNNSTVFATGPGVGGEVEEGEGGINGGRGLDVWWEYTDDVLLNGIPETYIILLTSVILI